MDRPNIALDQEVDTLFLQRARYQMFLALQVIPLPLQFVSVAFVVIKRPHAIGIEMGVTVFQQNFPYKTAAQPDLACGQ